MADTVMLAHGGGLGLAFELGFFLVPIVVLVVLARWSKRKAAQLEAASDDGDEAA